MNMASKKKNMYYKHLNRRRVRSEMQIKSEVKGTQVAASTQKNHSMLARLQEPEAGAHMWEKNSSTGLTWLNYHPNFMNILKCVARTTNIVDRFKCVGVCVCVYVSTSWKISSFSAMRLGSSILLLLAQFR